MNRVVFDTNLWISFMRGRRLGALLEVFENIEYEFVTTEMQRKEIHNVAICPKFRKYFSEESVLELDSWFALHTTNVEIVEIPKCSWGSKDDYLLELAIQANAIYLVSCVNDLLDIGTIDGCGIMTVSQFLQEVGGLDR